VLSLREKEFVEAARATGASNLSIIGREILPNLVTPVVVYAALVIPQVILLEAALSYLGVGINPPQASWGQMIADATPLFDSAWWYFLFPGLALVLTVLAFNLLGEAVRDALDPHMSRS
jgi:ABC-type dipeptide/oligopeptide/nickel transport system permease subunit